MSDARRRRAQVSADDARHGVGAALVALDAVLDASDQDARDLDAVFKVIDDGIELSGADSPLVPLATWRTYWPVVHVFDVLLSGDAYDATPRASAFVAELLRRRIGTTQRDVASVLDTRYGVDSALARAFVRSDKVLVRALLDEYAREAMSPPDPRFYASVIDRLVVASDFSPTLFALAYDLWSANFDGDPAAQQILLTANFLWRAVHARLQPVRALVRALIDRIVARKTDAAIRNSLGYLNEAFDTLLRRGLFWALDEFARIDAALFGAPRGADRSRGTGNALASIVDDNEALRVFARLRRDVVPNVTEFQNALSGALDRNTTRLLEALVAQGPSDAVLGAVLQAAIRNRRIDAVRVLLDTDVRAPVAIDTTWPIVTTSMLLARRIPVKELTRDIEFTIARIEPDDYEANRIDAKRHIAAMLVAGGSLPSTIPSAARDVVDAAQRLADKTRAELAAADVDIGAQSVAKRARTSMDAAAVASGRDPLVNALLALDALLEPLALERARWSLAAVRVAVYRAGRADVIELFNALVADRVRRARVLAVLAEGSERAYNVERLVDDASTVREKRRRADATAAAHAAHIDAGARLALPLTGAEWSDERARALVSVLRELDVVLARADAPPWPDAARAAALAADRRDLLGLVDTLASDADARALARSTLGAASVRVRYVERLLYVAERAARKRARSDVHAGVRQSDIDATGDATNQQCARVTAAASPAARALASLKTGARVDEITAFARVRAAIGRNDVALVRALAPALGAERAADALALTRDGSDVRRALLDALRDVDATFAAAARRSQLDVVRALLDSMSADALERYTAAAAAASTTPARVRATIVAYTRRSTAAERVRDVVERGNPLLLVADDVYYLTDAQVVDALALALDKWYTPLDSIDVLLESARATPAALLARAADDNRPRVVRELLGIVRRVALPGDDADALSDAVLAEYRAYERALDARARALDALARTGDVRALVVALDAARVNMPVHAVVDVLERAAALPAESHALDELVGALLGTVDTPARDRRALFDAVERNAVDVVRALLRTRSYSPSQLAEIALAPRLREPRNDAWRVPRNDAWRVVDDAFVETQHYREPNPRLREFMRNRLRVRDNDDDDDDDDDDEQMDESPPSPPKSPPLSNDERIVDAMARALDRGRADAFERLRAAGSSPDSLLAIAARRASLNVVRALLAAAPQSRATLAALAYDDERSIAPEVRAELVAYIAREFDERADADAERVRVVRERLLDALDRGDTRALVATLALRVPLSAEALVDVFERALVRRVDDGTLRTLVAATIGAPRAARRAQRTLAEAVARNAVDVVRALLRTHRFERESLAAIALAPAPASVGADAWRIVNEVFATPPNYYTSTPLTDDERARGGIAPMDDDLSSSLELIDAATTSEEDGDDNDDEYSFGFRATSAQNNGATRALQCTTSTTAATAPASMPAATGTASHDDDDVKAALDWRHPRVVGADAISDDVEYALFVVFSVEWHDAGGARRTYGAEVRGTEFIDVYVTHGIDSRGAHTVDCRRAAIERDGAAVRYGVVLALEPANVERTLAALDIDDAARRALATAPGELPASASLVFSASVESGTHDARRARVPNGTATLALREVFAERGAASLPLRKSFRQLNVASSGATDAPAELSKGTLTVHALELIDRRARARVDDAPRIASIVRLAPVRASDVLQTDSARADDAAAAVSARRALGAWIDESVERLFFADAAPLRASLEPWLDSYHCPFDADDDSKTTLPGGYFLAHLPTERRVDAEPYRRALAAAAAAADIDLDDAVRALAAQRRAGGALSCGALRVLTLAFNALAELAVSIVVYESDRVNNADRPDEAPLDTEDFLDALRFLAGDCEDSGKLVYTLVVLAGRATFDAHSAGDAVWRAFQDALFERRWYVPALVSPGAVTSPSLDARADGTPGSREGAHTYFVALPTAALVDALVDVRDPGAPDTDLRARVLRSRAIVDARRYADAALERSLRTIVVEGTAYTDACSLPLEAYFSRTRADFAPAAALRGARARAQSALLEADALSAAFNLSAATSAVEYSAAARAGTAAVSSFYTHVSKLYVPFADVGVVSLAALTATGADDSAAGLRNGVTHAAFLGDWRETRVRFVAYGDWTRDATFDDGAPQARLAVVPRSAVIGDALLQAFPLPTLRVARVRALAIAPRWLHDALDDAGIDTTARVEYASRVWRADPRAPVRDGAAVVLRVRARDVDASSVDDARRRLTRALRAARSHFASATVRAYWLADAPIERETVAVLVYHVALYVHT